MIESMRLITGLRWLTASQLEVMFGLKMPTIDKAVKRDKTGAGENVWYIRLDGRTTLISTEYAVMRWGLPYRREYAGMVAQSEPGGGYALVDTEGRTVETYSIVALVEMMLSHAPLEKWRETDSGGIMRT